MSAEMKRAEEIFLNPQKYADEQQQEKDSIAQMKKELLDKKKEIEAQKRLFDEEERTTHPDIPPANYRIEFYKKR